MIQIDMQMPERCGVCFAFHTDEIGLESWCGIDETARDIYTEEIIKKRPDWCPLKEQEEERKELERLRHFFQENISDPPAENQACPPPPEGVKEQEKKQITLHKKHVITWGRNDEFSMRKLYEAVCEKLMDEGELVIVRIDDHEKVDFTFYVTHEDT